MSPTQSDSKVVRCGTHRVRDPEQTFSSLQPFLRTLGITRVANVTGLDTIGIPTVLITRPSSRSLSVSQGKGLDLLSAKVSGVMESLEHYCAERTELPLRLASFAELSRRGDVIDVTCLPRTARWHPKAPTLWCHARQLHTHTETYVPFELVHVNLTVPLPAGSGQFALGSNGLASGNILDEAIAHGAFELIERDAVSLFYQMTPRQQQARRIELSTVNDESCRSLLARYREADVKVAVWDVTSDVGVAAFFCAIVEAHFDPFRRIGKAYGFGCHNDRAVALCRALTEAAQSRLTRITGSRDDLQELDHDAIRSERAILRHQAELAAPKTPQRSFQDVPHREFDTVHGDLEWLSERLAAADLGPLHYVDLSKPDLPFAVARVIVPGLEGTAEAPGYQPGVRAQLARAEGLS